MQSFYIIFFSLYSHLLFAQAPAIQWQHCLGGTDADAAFAISQANDGGYFVTGQTYSTDGDIVGQHGKEDLLAFKVDKNGYIQWQHTLGGSSLDQGTAIQATSDGGCLIGGYTFSNDGDVIGQHGGGNPSDGWVIKLDKNGSIQWQKCLGGTGTETIDAVALTADGGYIVAGSTSSVDGDLAGVPAGQGAWVIKLDKNGSIQWQKHLDGGSIVSIKPTRDGGYITSGSIGGGPHGAVDVWLAKLTINGTIQWQRSLGGSGNDFGASVDTTYDKGYIMAATTESDNGDVKGHHPPGGDYWVVKVDSSGSIQWQKCLGGYSVEKAYSIKTATNPKNGYIVVGYTSSDDEDVTGRYGNWLIPDIWAVKLDTTGKIQWKRCLGGSGSDIGTAITTTSDGGYVIAGYTASKDYDVVGLHGSGPSDGWIVKLAAENAPCMQVNITGKTTFCDGASSVLSASIVGGVAPYSYQWKQGSVSLASTSSYTVTTTGTYSVIITDSKSCSIASTGVSVKKVDVPAVPTITASVAAINPGGSSVLQTVVPSGLTIQWLLNNAVIPGATQANYTATSVGNYSVRVMNKDSCTATSQTYTLNILTAREELMAGSDFTIFASPNPTSNLIKIEIQNKTVKSIISNLSLKDISGQILQQKNIKLVGRQTEYFDLSRYQPGIYIITLSTESQQTSWRIVLN